MKVVERICYSKDENIADQSKGELGSRHKEIA